MRTLKMAPHIPASGRQSFTERRLALRALLEGKACITPAPVFDPIGAVMAKDLGFEMGMCAGSSMAATVLAAPDLILLTLDELADQVRRISRASGLPLLVDADHGYGNALNVIRCVEELEAAGASGMTIEDSDLPARYGNDKVGLISDDEAEAKIAAALSARIDPATVIVARTSLAKTDLANAVERVGRFTAVGADAIFLHQVSSEAQIEAIRSGTDLPLIVGSGLPRELNNPDFLDRHGVRVLLAGHQPLAAAVAAIHAALAALRPGATDPMPSLASREMIDGATRVKFFERQTRDFLAGG
jgi:oxaloacetate decarboxylase